MLSAILKLQNMLSINLQEMGKRIKNKGSISKHNINII